MKPTTMCLLRQWMLAALAALVLTACGGGGGGGGNNGAAPSATSSASTPAPAATTPALRFTPERVTTTVEAGTSANLVVNAAVARPEDFNGPVYALVEAGQPVILPAARLLATSATGYAVTLQTSPSLAPGLHEGQFSVKLCRDTACASQYPGSPLSLPYSLTVTTSTATATTLSAIPDTALEGSMHLGGAAPRQMRVAVDTGNVSWSAVTYSSWLKLGNNTGIGKGSFTVDFVLPPDRPWAEGIYLSEITVSTADGKRVVLPVKFTVLAASFQFTGDRYDFWIVNGAPAPSSEVSFSLDNGMTGPWTLTPLSGTAWLKISPQSGTLPGKVTVTVDTVNSKLESGTYYGSSLINSPFGRTSGLSVKLTLLKPTLSTSVETVAFGGTNGRDFTGKPLTLSLNTGKNAWPWTLTSMPPWIKASATSGTVSESGSTLTLTPDPSLAPMGSTTSLLTAQATVNGETVTTSIPVTINRDQHKILPSVTGIALVATPGWSRLTRTIGVSDNYSLGSGWSAASDKSWLSVVRNGDTLTLQADPASLPLDTTSHATVTLTPTASGASAPEKIRVGLWKGSSTPSATSKLTVPYNAMVADPVRPLVYVHEHGGTIDAYNVYTGQKTGSVTIGAYLGEMAVSADGSRLYAPDAFSHDMFVVDLDTMSLARTLSLQAIKAPAYSRPLVIRPNGMEIVLTDNGAYRTSDGKRLSDNGFGDSKAASQDGRRVFTIDEGISPASTMAYTVDYSDTGGGVLLLARTGWVLGYGSNGQDIAANADGSRVYTASGSPYRCVASGPDLSGTLLPGAGPYPVSVEVDSFGRVYCGIATTSASPDVWLYDAGGSLLRSFDFTSTGLLRRQLAVSGDGMLMIGLTEYSVMAIVPVGP